MHMTAKEKMLCGKLYLASDRELTKLRIQCQKRTRDLNRTTIYQQKKSEKILRALFGCLGENPIVERPFRCDYGCNISAGDNLFINYNCTILDVCRVTLGDNVFIAPNVSFYTAAHPIDAEVRNTQLEYGKPITVGSNVWICGNVVVNPGVHIGSNVVIGSGSVVTHDIPDNCVAAGNPCEKKREITDRDMAYWKASASS